MLDLARGDGSFRGATAGATALQISVKLWLVAHCQIEAGASTYICVLHLDHAEWAVHLGLQPANSRRAFEAALVAEGVQARNGCCLGVVLGRVIDPRDESSTEPSRKVLTKKTN